MATDSPRYRNGGGPARASGRTLVIVVDCPDRPDRIDGARGFDGGQSLRAGPPVVFRHVDLDPRIAPRLHDVQRPAARKYVEGSRQPVAGDARGDERVDLFDEHGRAAAA